MFKSMHEFLEGTIAGVTSEQGGWKPQGLANSIGANYGHVVFAEDGGDQRCVRGGAPLMASGFAGKTGASEPPPPGFAWSIGPPR